GANVDALRPVLEQTLAPIDRLMSPWRPDSTLSRFNARESTEWQRVDAETLAVARAALALRRISEGAFDPSVGPLVARWGFGPIAASAPSGNAGFDIGEDALRKGHSGL